jgi:serine/threonine-protein kinase RsbW
MSNGEPLGAGNKILDVWLDSSLDSVDDAESRVLQIAEDVRFEEEDLHKLGMAVREAMVNAVVHGNRYNARKRVHLEVSQEDDRLRISITDEGEGFDPKSLPDPLAAENLLRQSGRGILLIQAFVDEFLIQPATPQGTRMTLVKYRGGKQ